MSTSTIIAATESIYPSLRRQKSWRNGNKVFLDNSTSIREMDFDSHRLQDKALLDNRQNRVEQWSKTIRMQQFEERENRNSMSLQRGEAIRHREIHTAGPSVSTQDLILDPESFKMDRDRKEQRRKAATAISSRKSIRPPLASDLEEMKAISQQISLKSHRKKAMVNNKKVARPVSIESLEIQESTLLRSLSTLLDGRSRSIKNIVNIAKQEAEEFAGPLTEENEKDLQKRWKKKTTPFNLHSSFPHGDGEPELVNVYNLESKNPRNKEKNVAQEESSTAENFQERFPQEDSNSSSSEAELRSKTGPRARRKKQNMPSTSSRAHKSSRSTSKKDGNLELKRVSSNDAEWWKLHLRERFVQTGNLLDKLMVQRISFERDFHNVRDRIFTNSCVV